MGLTMPHLIVVSEFVIFSQSRGDSVEDEFEIGGVLTGGGCGGGGLALAIGAEPPDEFPEVDPEDPRAAMREPAAKASAKAKSPAGKAAPSAKVAPKASAAASSSGSGGHGGGAPAIPPDVETVTGVAKAMPAKGRGRGRGRAMGGRGRGRAEEPPREPRDYIPAIGGGHACFREYTAPGALAGTAFARAGCDNWMFKCPHHHNCFRTMGLGPTNTRRGVLEPLAFLHVWRDTPPDPEKGHRKTPVDDALVERFLNENRAALQAMQDHFGLSP